MLAGGPGSSPGASTRIIANERLVDAVRRLELDGVVFKELEAR